jgi:hypothetical protein
MKKIKLGSKVKYRLRGETTLRTAAVTEIQITRNHDKMEGRIAKSCDLDKHKSVIFSLDDGHWCWEDQIRQII